MTGDNGTSRASVEQVLEILTKAVPGQLRRIPRHPDHREVVLAILCVGMHRRYPYTEIEVNEFFESRLAKLNSRVDHVTCRRFMVDLGFVKRDRPGTRYFLNYPKLEATLSAEAMASADELIDKVLAEAHRRQSRSRRRTTAT
jgi:hypothetical protein